METAHSRRLGASPGTSKVTVPFYVPPPSVKKTSAEIINEARASIKKGITVPSNELGMGISPSIRPLDTKRPFTPRERQRTLFGTSNRYNRRPPSSFSLGYLQFQEPDVGPPTPPNLRKLNPLPFSPTSLNSPLNSSPNSSTSSTEQSCWKNMVSGNAIDLSERIQSFNRREQLGSKSLPAPKLLPRFDGSPPKLRLPAIGSGSHLVSRLSKFRATASLDNLPEEVEGDDNESSPSTVSDRSISEPPLMRKAYSSPVQRTNAKEDLDIDVFGTLEDSELQSPTSYKRSLNYDHENVGEPNKMNQLLPNCGINKKCKGDAWGPSIDNIQSSQVIVKNSECTMDGPSKEAECIEINELDNSNGCIELKLDSPKNIVEQSNLEHKRNNYLNINRVTSFGNADVLNRFSNDKMEEDKSETKISLNQSSPDQDKRSLPKEEIKLNQFSGKYTQGEQSQTSYHHSVEINYNLVENQNNKDMIESSRMFKNLDMNDSVMVPGSPDVEYMSLAKHNLDTGLCESNIDNCVDDLQNKPFKKPDNYKPPKPFNKGRIYKNKDKSVSQSMVQVDVPVIKSNVKCVVKDPILEPIQQAMLENFPLKDTSIRTPHDKVNTTKEERLSNAKEAYGPRERNDPINSTLELLSRLSHEDGNDIEVILALSKLYKVLEAENALVSNPKYPKLQSQVIKIIYKFVERSNETLLLQIARIILAFRVNGSNLSGVCKLVFKVSRCDKNDSLFLEDNILELFVEALGLASPLEDAEACVYGYGALKFLTMNNLVLSAVLGFGILELMVLHMKLVNVARAEGSRIPEQTSHALFQLTGALRNVAGEEEMFPQFVSTGAVLELCRAMELFSSDLDVISNVSRTLSIISTHDDCCNSIISYENCFFLFVKLLKKYPGRQDIVVRLGYALGNLMAKSEVARIKLYEEKEAVDAMLNLLTIYLEKDQQIQDLETHNNLITSDAGSNGSIEDVIVKIIRILANMSINPLVGSKLSGSTSDIMFQVNEDTKPIFEMENDSGSNINQKQFSEPYSNRFLDILLSLLHCKTLRDSDELMHSALSSLNNLSYYSSCGYSTFGERQLEIAEGMFPVLDSENRECLVEAMRVYGNLSRSEESRNFLLQKGGFAKLIKFLDTDDRELMSASAGILVNMMADWDKRVALKENRGIQILIRILKSFCEGDWQLATLVCQALWNYCIESNNLHAAFGVEETNELLGVLADYLDEERLFGVKEGAEINEYLAASLVYQQWEEFAAVATNLLEKIDSFLDSLEPLEVLPSPTEELTEPNSFVSVVTQENMSGHEE